MTGVDRLVNGGSNQGCARFINVRDAGKQGEARRFSILKFYDLGFPISVHQRKSAVRNVFCFGFQPRMPAASG